MTLLLITLDEQIQCVARELNMRARVYPRRVADGKMAAEEATRETERMTAVLNTLKSVREERERAKVERR